LSPFRFFRAFCFAFTISVAAGGGGVLSNAERRQCASTASIMSGVLTQPSRVRNVRSFIVVGFAPLAIIATVSTDAARHISEPLSFFRSYIVSLCREPSRPCELPTGE